MIEPSTTPLSTISSINLPDTYDNNLEMSDADHEVTKEVDSKTLVITDTSSFVKKSSQMKRNDEGVLYLMKKQKSTFSSLSSESTELSILK